MTDDNASIARRIREIPECAHDPILYSAATSIERGADPARVLLGALRAYASDAARLRAVAAETLAKYGTPIVVAVKAVDPLPYAPPSVMEVRCDACRRWAKVYGDGEYTTVDAHYFPGGAHCRRLYVRASPSEMSTIRERTWT